MNSKRIYSFTVTAVLLTILAHALRAEEPGEVVTPEPLPTQTEARGRARLLHETIHATLQIVHHRYFREDEGIPVPALTLKTVFKELAISRKVKLRWLAVNAQAMSVDHYAQDDFEHQAVKALSAGQEEFAEVEGDVYRYAAVIMLHSECLKCHLPNRKSTKPRAAALVISMPIEGEQPK